jgi:predicted O-methyltransferase YrrM
MIAPTLNATTTTPVMNQLEALVADVPGWSPLDQLYTLFQLAYATSGLPGNIVEVGSWCGRSALALGLAVRLSGQGHVYCVDLFPGKDDWTQNRDGSYSFRVSIGGQTYGGHQTQTVWQKPFESDIAPLYTRRHSLLDLFVENISARRLHDVITPLKGNTDVFARSMPSDFRCRLVFLDGDHSYESVCRDIETMERFLVPGGWICFDDAFSSYDGVNRAIQDRILGDPRYELGQQMTRKFFVARKRA